MGCNREFHGTYLAEDVTFLLRRLQLDPVPLEERERLIQSGRRHYSEMIGPEDAPTRERLRLFHQCFDINAGRLASDLVTLSAQLAESANGSDLTLVSIARAGTPVGAILTRLLRVRLGAERVRHYSISVIRDRGVDLNAIDWIADRHPVETIRFVDGWTGKGTIAREMATSLATTRYRHQIDAGLWVPLDISGSARKAAGIDDYLIPSALLGGTISGLVSRSVLLPGDIGSPQFHGCMELHHLRRFDLTRWFVNQMQAMCANVRVIRDQSLEEGAHARSARSQQFIAELMQEFMIHDINRVKIGIGEAVRVALRRIPDRILLRDTRSDDALLIARLCRLRGIRVEHRAMMPHAAVGLIANLAGGRRVGAY